MAKVQVTIQLAELIKSIRIENNILSKDLAQHINKSPAYISKLEKGEINSLDKKTLIDILDYITAGRSSFDDLIVEVFANLKFKYSEEEIRKQLWFDNFDTVERLIPIPEDLIDEFQNEIKRLNISNSYLLERINANEALTDDVRNCTEYGYNEWFNIPGTNPNNRTVKILMSQDELDGILNKATTKARYIFIYAIAFYLKKIGYCGIETNIDDDLNYKLMEEAVSLLNQHKFYSLQEKNKLISEAQTPEDVENILSSFDRQNKEVINEILGGYKFWSERDIKSANEDFQTYLNNMKWDLGFMMKIISLKFSMLSELNYTNKKALVDEITALIEKYNTLPDGFNKVEVY